MVEETPQKSKIISKHDFYFETPLYEVISLSVLEDDTFTGDVDAYSSKNHTETTYSVSTEKVSTWSEWNTNKTMHVAVGFFEVTLTCKRKDNDLLRFFMYRDQTIAMKVGQYPSLADMQFAEIGKKYDGVLSKEDLKNLKKAIGLAAHGAGAGSFVYLRRIFENLIFETFKNNVLVLEATEDNFKTKRMEDKVEALKAVLPSQLVEMKSIYGILSKGVHELTEEECLNYFSPLKLSIELILDQKIEENMKKERNESVKKQLQNINQKLAGGNTT